MMSAAAGANRVPRASLAPMANRVPKAEQVGGVSEVHAAMLTDFRHQGCRGKATGLSPGLTFGLSIGLSNSAVQRGGTGHGG